MLVAARSGLAAGVLALCLLAGAVRAQSAAIAPDDMVMGSPKAPITVVEYGSVGCPHCGAWARDVFPAFKAKYIDTGQVKFVFREVLLGDPAAAAAGFLTARCAGKAKYFNVIDAIFEAQPEMERTGSDLPSLNLIALQNGLTQAKFIACLEDHVALAALQARSDHYLNDEHITGTPTFLVGEQRLPSGGRSLAEMIIAVSLEQQKITDAARRKAR
jgi:protein-disulfide isomerase